MSLIVNLFPFSRYKIAGHSMEPTLKEGQVVWVNKWAYFIQKPKVGDIVLFEVGEKRLVKRLKEKQDTRVFLIGDNKSDSFDSQQLGWLEEKQILGRVLI